MNKLFDDSDYTDRFREDPELSPNKCEVCDEYQMDGAEAHVPGIDWICDDCAMKDSDIFLCERCNCYAVDYGPGGEDCQSCYESSIDAAHDRMKEAF